MSLADTVVIGGGLAGVLAADVLHGRGASVTVIDGGARRASDAPCAIVHPFVGGTFVPRPNVEQAWRASHAWFSARAGFVRTEVVRRHLPHTKAGERLLRTWPEVEPLARRLFSHVRGPGPDARFVEYGPVLAVDLQALLEAERVAQERAGVQWCRGWVSGLQRDGSRWRLELEGGGARCFDRVVVAAGGGARALLRRFADTSSLAYSEGTLAWAPGALAGPFRIHGGHASGAPTRMAWGATYRMLDGDRRDPDQALVDIDARLRAVGAELPPLSGARRWTATRLMDIRTRTPWVHEHGPGLWSLCAFGSQGCLWAPWTAQQL